MVIEYFIHHLIGFGLVAYSSHVFAQNPVVVPIMLINVLFAHLLHLLDELRL